MPTPTGKAKPGDWVRDKSGAKIYYVRERLGNEAYYSVRVEDRTGRAMIITEFPFWVRQRGWTIGS